MTKNHFHTLGLRPGCTEDEVKKAFRTLAKQFHPDKNKDAGAEEKFKEIAGAYEVLKNEDRRGIHEREVSRRTTSYTSNTTNGYTETKNRNHDESAWSRKFGENSRKFDEHAKKFEEHSKKFGEQDNRYNKSSFGHFADEGRNSYREAHGKHSNKKPNQKPKHKQSTNSQSTNSRPRRPWSNQWTAPDDTDQFYDIPDPQPQHANFSFAFKSFMDDLGMSFDAFFMGPEVPNGTFGFSAFFDAPESSREYARFNDMDSRLFKCTYCHKRMPFSQLSMHEPGCALRHGGRFDVSDDEEKDKAETEAEDIYNGMGSPDEDQYPQNTGDWRQTHEELLKNIRKAKQAAQSTQRRYSSATTPSTKETKKNEDEGIAQIKCKWCGRSFSHPSAKHHIPFCEKWTKEHGTPLNPAGKPPTRDAGSKNQKAKEYAKHIPKPQRTSEDYESDSPRTHYDSFPNVGVHSKRETMNKPGAPSGTGLHASFSHRDKSSSPSPSFSTAGTHTARSRTTSRASTGTSKYMPTFGEDHSGPSFTIPVDNSYGFGLSGTKIKTESRDSRTSDGCCPVCRKKYGVHGRFLCNCGVRKTGC